MVPNSSGKNGKGGEKERIIKKESVLVSTPFLFFKVKDSN